MINAFVIMCQSCVLLFSCLVICELCVCVCVCQKHSNKKKKKTIEQ